MPCSWGEAAAQTALAGVKEQAGGHGVRGGLAVRRDGFVPASFAVMLAGKPVVGDFGDATFRSRIARADSAPH